MDVAPRRVRPVEPNSVGETGGAMLVDRQQALGSNGLDLGQCGLVGIHGAQDTKPLAG